VASFNESYSSRELKGQIDNFLQGVQKLAKMGQRVTLSQKEAGEVLVTFMSPILDELVKKLRRYGGESVETTCADYWAAKAVAYGMASKTVEGRTYYEQSRNIRAGGLWQEWCQNYYK
jgi:hypothetical protein